MSPDFYWGVLLGLLAILVAVLVPLLLQLRRTAQRAEQFMGQTENELVPLLRDLRETSARAAKMAQAAEEDISRLKPLFRSLGEAGQSLHALTGALNTDLFRYIGSLLGLWLGMRSTKKTFSSDKPKNTEANDHG